MFEVTIDGTWECIGGPDYVETVYAETLAEAETLATEAKWNVARVRSASVGVYFD